MLKIALPRALSGLTGLKLHADRIGPSMAIAGLGFSTSSYGSLRIPLYHCCVRKLRLSYVAAFQALDDEQALISCSSSDPSAGSGKQCDYKSPEKTRFSSEELGISTSMIPRPTRKVLNGLKKKGYEVYLVGGCVRDLILKRIPKDFDVITSAELKEVLRTFSWCEIVGKRFPICHVHIDDTVVEVSSFSTSSRTFECDSVDDSEKPMDFDEKDYIRWRNCLQRDFTINGLLFDPYSRIVYDYMEGIKDIKKAKVKTVIPATTSFQEDCARILRAIRIAARLGFRFSKDTSHCICNLSCSILRLDKGRLLMEMNYMLAYGSAEVSLRLLWKFGLLEILLPIQAAYFVQHGFRRRDKRSNMLLSLFSNLDKLLAPDRPCNSSLWVAMLVFHLALSMKPRDPSVVAPFCLAVHNGGDMTEAVSIARRITKTQDFSFPELLENQNMDSQALTAEVMDLSTFVGAALNKMTDEHFVSQAMAGYPEAPYSDLVFIPLVIYLKVGGVFECIGEGAKKKELAVGKQGRRINYQSLTLGNLAEIRHVFARIVFDTLYPPHLN